MLQEKYDSSDVLIEKEIQILPVLKFHFEHLLKSNTKANIEKTKILGS